MADENYNIIKPVEALPNVAGSTPAKRRDRRKRRQDQHAEDNHQSEENNESLEAPQLDEQSDDVRQKQDPESTGIDYCA